MLDEKWNEEPRSHETPYKGIHALVPLMHLSVKYCVLKVRRWLLDASPRIVAFHTLACLAVMRAYLLSQAVDNAFPHNPPNPDNKASYCISHIFSLAVMRAYSLCQLRYYPKVMGPSMIEETYRAGATLADISTVV